MILVDRAYSVKNFKTENNKYMVPSAIFSVFYNDEVLHLTIDSGCTGNIIRLNVVERLNIMMKPTKIKAKLADDKTYLEVVGEIDINLTRGKTSFKFEAIVVTQLGPDILAGTPFMKTNDVMTDFVNELVIVQKKIQIPIYIAANNKWCC